MDATKKRKREVESPLITYETDSRTFDRLFKEDSLDGLKAVVRRKLNLLPSVQVSLSQLRNGKSVDLEDDDDFEAFSASAHAASAVKVKVLVGRAQVSAIQGQAEVPLSSSKRKRKKKQKSSQDNSPAPSFEPSEDVTLRGKPVDMARVAKKRRVSFVETLPNTLLKSTEPLTGKSNKPFVGDFITPSQQEPLSNVPVGPGETERSVENKKKKKKDKETGRDSRAEDERAVEEADRTASAKEKGKTSHSLTSASQPSDKADELSKPKKRRRNSVAIETQSVEFVPKSSSKASSSGLQTIEGEGDRPAKKLKDKHSSQNDSSAATPLELSKSTKRKPKAQPETTKQSDSAPSEPKKDPAKRKKKDKDASGVATSAPEAIESVTTAEKISSKEERNTLKTPTPKKPKSTEASVPEAPLSKVGDTSKKSKKPKKKSGARETKDKPQPTDSQSPKTAKTPKKSKKKDTVVSAGPAEDNSLVNEAPKIDMKEVTRRVVAAIMSRKAAQANATDQPEDLSVDGQPVHTPVQPVAKSAKSKQQTHESAQAPTSAPEKSEPLSKCPICGESPSHVRSKCPTIKAGIRAMRKRISELQAETSEDEKEERLKLISELQTYVDKKTRKPRTSEVAKPAAPVEPVPAVPNNAVREVPSNVPAHLKSTSTAQQIANSSPSAPQPPVNAESSRPPKPMQSPANPKAAPAIPTATVRSLSLSSVRPPILSQISTSRKAPEISDAFEAPVVISAGPLRPDFLGLGDVSSYTDKDLEAIIRGPRMSVKDVPESDTEEESEQEPEATLEEDAISESKAQRNAGRVEYPTSSDEGDEQENWENPAAAVTPEPETSSITTARPVRERSISSDNEEMQVGDASFKDVEANGSSRELDRTGDFAANNAPRVDVEADSDTAVASQTEGRVDEQEASTGKLAVSPVLPAEEPGLDPIESSEPPPRSQPEPIVSDDDQPMQSTPKAQVNLRTRRQRGKPGPNENSGEAQSTQPTPCLDNTIDAGDGPKSTRKGRGLVKISELPIPPNPSVRVIRPAPAPKSRRQAAQESQEESRDAEKAPESNTRITRSAAAAKAAATNTPAKTPAKASKTPAKTVMKMSSTKHQSKAVASNGVSNTRTRSRIVVAVADPDPQPSQASNMTLPESQGTVASWAVLQDSGPSQTDTEAPAMVDELLPSPQIVTTSGRNQKGQAAVAAAEPLPEPLFVPTDSQQSFPYSQYPDLLPHKQAAVSPNESDDEEEVAAAIGRPAASGRKSSMFRGLSEIASQPTLFKSRLSQQFPNTPKEPIENLYGPSGQDSEESDSGSESSDSEAEKKAAASHIPASRRAGASFAKKK
ncbi:hypothetical protein CPB84DRAFT_1781513 [Gymnopilus junonius]|uniref:Uncharacterized protein n=1 Tax=Gymnopilus junonius TaxID=109634 RepID=A0A9P5NMS0_GYMJU|nr:hypothetical protein CPB84DRAFT_1781513 [Gymnopilus junonius]